MEEQHSKKSTLLCSRFHLGFALLLLMGLTMIVLNFGWMKSGGNETNAEWKKYPDPKLNHRIDQLKENNLSLWTDRLLQCGYQNHSFTPEERSEGTVLMKMIEWPKPPNPAVPFRKSSDPSRAQFVIINSGKTFYVGDQLEVMLRMYNFEGNPKLYGGDYLQARIHTPELKAGSAGTVTDHQNGLYYINFTLSWPGKVQVSVSLVHPSEGVQALARLRKEYPDRVYFRSTFKSGDALEVTVCNLCLPQTKPLCNFTDLRTGEPWFCYKPKKLPCSSRINHAMGGYMQSLLIGEEGHYFQSGKNVKVPILPKDQGYVIVEPSPHADKDLSECLTGKPLLSPSGFYYQDKWVSNTCNIQHFDTPASVTNCLRGKIVYIFGDSTIRQWFEYLTYFVPGLRKFDLGNSMKTGPHLALDMNNTIKIDYFAHGKPIRIQPISSQDLPFIANKLDDIKGGKNTVIAFTIWCHFNTFPVEPYIRRLQNIRRSILRLLARSPDTVIVIKTANVQALPREVSLYNSDWFSYQLDLVMRRMFAGIKVAFVDAWEMTIAHYLPHDLHPKQIIIKNELRLRFVIKRYENINRPEMEEQLTPFAHRSLPSLLVLMTFSMLILNTGHMKCNEHSVSKTELNRKHYPNLQSYPSSKEKIKNKRSSWTDRLLQCGYLNQSFTPEERSEGTILMKIIKWPKPPKPAVPFRKSSDPSRTRFVIINSGKTFYVGDQLQVMLQMYDFEGNPKQYGGDYLQARIHTPELKAGSAGTVIDNQNGSYYINFNLSWPGKVQVSVSLVHPSEGIEVLKWLREEEPDRVYFQSAFKSMNISEITVCNLCLPQNKPLCNFTDIKIWEPWFCYKPKKLPCSSRVSHAIGGYKRHLITEDEGRLFHSKINIKEPILSKGLEYVTVKASAQRGKDLGKCIPGKPLLSPSGFYFRDQWSSTSCNIRQFKTPANVIDCLRGKRVHIFGDSTIRQWFEFMIEFVPGLKKLTTSATKKFGPYYVVDVENNITMHYYIHGIPIRIPFISILNLPFIANKLDDIKGGKNTVIAFTIWCHFNTFPVEHYIRRLQNIRRSILRLLDRSPDTVIVIKTANVQALPRDVSLYTSDWFSYQLDLVMRRMFEGIKVAFVDAWEMTLAHYLPHDLHPKQIIIKNEVDMFLSYICPLEK